MNHAHWGRPRVHGSRRRSVVWALAFSVLTLVLAVPGTSAGVGWCRDDPVVVIDGQIADIFISAKFEDLAKVNGPTQIVVSIPVGVDVALAVAGPGFGHGEHISFAESESLKVTSEGIDVRIKVRVPARSDAMPIRVEFAPHVVGVLQPAADEGTANDWISLRTLL
ncbi:MAG: hypothetical protein AVDCRST_MAG87-1664 [uncultured Thermomicrobiales bacterium]|uniref:Uncharacterized protein n=1 Tax=uncultured Thermomicrobiales bacterium TaxID=1645740 RepID=A0A6J4UYL0_9BACT|nr:MAG: hypothetical protein AVDCRST_MAG87-1664 [uncultured Thermomicrobiales bacterium]